MNVIVALRRALLPAFAILAAFGFHACTDATSRTSVASNPFPAALRDPDLQALVTEYDRFFADSMSGSHTPGAALVIVKDSVVIFQRGYGLKSTRGQDSAGVHTVFRIGSLSKGFAGVLTGILVQEGQLNWDDRIIRYVPEFKLSSPEQTRQITLSHLLSHTTGLPYHAYTDMIESGFTLKDIAPRFERLRIYGKPGEAFSYQNVAFSLVGEAMQFATGKTYAEVLNDKIFKPAGMQTASADWESIHRNTDKAMPHHSSGAGWVPDTISRRFYNAAPAGGVNASIADMGQWLKVLLGYRPDIVSKTTLDRVFQPIIRTNNERRYFRHWSGNKEAWYGMGWRVLVNNNDTIVYHGGAVNGFRGEIALDRRHGIAICALFNASTELPSASIPAFFERYRRIVGEKGN
ncbi:MAG: beta-lactamase family protein [Saprospiraceae bacterium]|nr:beta-lactamase family protein [Saprospiraceae bacterium]